MVKLIIISLQNIPSFTTTAADATNFFRTIDLRLIFSLNMLVRQYLEDKETRFRNDLINSGLHF